MLILTVAASLVYKLPALVNQVEIYIGSHEDRVTAPVTVDVTELDRSP